MRLKNYTRPHVPDLSRFRLSTCIRIRSAFDAKMLESLFEHALMLVRSMLVGDFFTFTSSFSKVYGYKHSHGSRFVAFSKVSNLETVIKSLRLQCALSPDTCGRRPDP